ncbi:hypothetical protein [Microbacterium sediminis]|uniref:Uncharacterized protein n=1 Tax=Microbacterium sediminis TaxID=904291 RepID=A0A1B9NGM9_9MICO|nr:hypothetical protein [Microbacterium sediminis]OCG75769.1 hypothetical protein A7J15_01605 [Microbacterium sediminis]QBR74162.1 hypothetical protein E3O41_06865 [Microbacterium sediminis]
MARIPGSPGTARLSRRQVLAVPVMTVLSGALAGCAPELLPRQMLDGRADVRALTTGPASSGSYGPNGTHFPPELPWPGAVAASDIEVECDWVQIARRIQALTPQQVEAGVIIRVAPGTLPGAGSGSSSRAVLAGVGNQEWPRNVLIVPRDGFGSVRIADIGARFDQCTRLSLFGFVSGGGFTLTRCVSMQIGWSRFDTANVTRGGRGIGFYELVVGFRRSDADTAAIRPTETFEMTDIVRYGCAFGPTVKPGGSGAHCDTLQLEGTGTGPFGPLLSVDCVDYGSSNAVFVLHTRVTRAEFQHCLVLGDGLPWQLFPLQPGDYDGRPNAFAGGCQDVRLYDSVVCGPIGSMRFTHVERTRLSYAPVESQQPSVSGRWEVDQAIAGWSRDDIMALQAVPDYEEETLRALWAW